MDLPKSYAQLEVEQRLLSEKVVYLKNALSIFREFPEYKDSAERLTAVIMLKESMRIIIEMCDTMSKKGFSTEAYRTNVREIDAFLKTQGIYFRILE